MPTSKNYIIPVSLILLALAIIAGSIYLTPILFTTLDKLSYRFVLIFLLFIISSNLLAKIARTYINL